MSADPPSTPRPSAAWRYVVTLLTLYTLYFGRDVLAPIAIAGVLGLLLAPVVARLKRWAVPAPIGAAVMVVGLVGLLGWGVVALSAPAADWLHRAPESFASIERKLRELKKPAREVQQATREVEKLTRVDPSAVPEVTLRGRGLTESLLSGTTLVVAQLAVIIILLYFLLASGDVLTRRLITALGRGAHRHRAVEIIRAMRHDVAVYLGTVTLINVGLGGATAVGMAVIGLPNPVLWGVMAMALNFIPYVGSLTTTVVLTLVALLSFDRLGQAVLAPLLFQALANIEANLVTPLLLGRWLALNPVLVFVSLVLWSWLWGVLGALLAVPFLVILKIFAEHSPSLEGLGIFLGRADPS